MSALAGFQVGQGALGSIGQGILQRGAFQLRQNEQALQTKDINSLIKYREEQARIQDEHLRLAAEEWAVIKKYMGEQPGIGGPQDPSFVGPMPPSNFTGSALDTLMQEESARKEVSREKQLKMSDSLIAILAQRGRKDDVLNLLKGARITSTNMLASLPSEQLTILLRSLTQLLNEPMPYKDPLTGLMSPSEEESAGKLGFPTLSQDAAIQALRNNP